MLDLFAISRAISASNISSSIGAQSRPYASSSAHKASYRRRDCQILALGHPQRSPECNSRVVEIFSERQAPRMRALARVVPRPMSSLEIAKRSTADIDLPSHARELKYSNVVCANPPGWAAPIDWRLTIF